KKIAEGARAIVFDVKCGNGAFMKTRQAAHSLASRLVATTRSLGAAASACVTDMSWPIGHAVGNALEVVEAWRVLRGESVPGTRPLTLALAAEMVRLAGAAPDPAAALARVTRALDDGSAAERFLALVRAQGGDASALERGVPLHPAPVVVELVAQRAGVLAGCDCFALGELIVAMGGGRRVKEDAVDPRVGVVILRSRGDRLEKGDVFANLHLASPSPEFVDRAGACFSIGAPGHGPPVDPLVLETIRD